MNDFVEHEKTKLMAITPTPMHLIEKAISIGVEPTQLKALMEMQSEWEDRQAKKAYVADMMTFKKSQPELYKDKMVKAGAASYSHVSLDMAATIIGPKLAEHGFYHRWKTENSGEKTIVSCIVTHKKGHSEISTLEAKEDKSGNKNDVQAIGSTITYLERYTLLAVLGLAAKGQDDDALQLNAINHEEFVELQELMEESGADAQKFCETFGIAAVKNLRGRDFRNARMLLKQKIKKNQEPDK